MRISIVGAGSIGLQLGAQLARAGHDPLLVVRSPTAASALAASGITWVDPATERRETLPIRVAAGIPQAGEALREGAVVLAVRAPDTAAAAEALAETAPDAWVVSAQNDVDNDALLARRFARVSGLVVRQTATRMAPTVVHAVGQGRLIVGDHPSGVGEATLGLASAFEDAGFSVGRTSLLAGDRWLKLCINLMTSVNALVRRSDHATASFVEVKARLLEEARDALAGCGIPARSGDGADRSLDEEIVHQRASLRRGTSARPIALYNGVWTALRHGGAALEADLYHERILGLALRAATPAPVNTRVLEVLRQVAESGRGPESVASDALLPG